jgi:hypothetical protein
VSEHGLRRQPHPSRMPPKVSPYLQDPLLPACWCSQAFQCVARHGLCHTLIAVAVLTTGKKVSEPGRER